MDTTFLNKPTDFYKYVEEVIHWNKVSQAGKEDFSAKKISDQKNFVLEEINELGEAIIAKDKEEVVDALADIVVTAGYWLYLKEPSLIKNSCKLMNFSLGSNHYNRIKYGFDDDDPWEVMQGVMSLFYQLDCKVDKVMREVLSANWTKFPKEDWYIGKYHCDNVDEFIDVVCNGINKGGRYSGVRCTKYDSRLIFHSDTNKIVKPPSFREPDHCENV